MQHSNLVSLCDQQTKNVLFCNYNRFTAIHHASLTGNAEIVMGLLDMECDASMRDKKGVKQ